MTHALQSVGMLLSGVMECTQFFAIPLFQGGYLNDALHVGFVYQLWTIEPVLQAKKKNKKLECRLVNRKSNVSVQFQALYMSPL